LDASIDDGTSRSVLESSHHTTFRKPYY